MRNDEHQIQCAIVDYLKLELHNSVRVIGISNNPRNAVAGSREKARGMAAGFPDLLLIGRDFTGVIEVKAPGEYMKANQKAWANWFEHNHIPHAVCRSIDDVKETLQEWGVKRRVNV